MPARRHRPRDELDRRNVRPTPRPQWAGTVLSQPPSSTTESIGCARVISSTSIDIRLRNFRLVGCQEGLAQRDGRKLDRQAARGQHAALDRIEHLGEMPVAVVEPARRMRDPTIGDPACPAVTHGAGERAAQVHAEFAVPVVRQPFRESDRPLDYYFLQLSSLMMCAPETKPVVLRLP